MPGHSPGARIQDGIGTSSACDPVPGAPVLRGVHHPGRDDDLFDELDVPGRLHDGVVIDRPQPAVQSAPSRTRWMVGVRYPTRENRCRRVNTTRTGRPSSRAAIAARMTLGRGSPLEPNPPPTCALITLHPFHRQAERAGDRLADGMAALVRVVEREVAVGEDRGGGVRFHRVVVLARSAVGRIQLHRAAGEGAVRVALFAADPG